MCPRAVRPCAPAPRVALGPRRTPATLALSWVGLRRVDPHAHPPVGRRGQALAGMAFGGLGCVSGVVLFVLLQR